MPSKPFVRRPIEHPILETRFPVPAPSLPDRPSFLEPSISPLYIHLRTFLESTIKVAERVLVKLISHDKPAHVEVSARFNEYLSDQLRQGDWTAHVTLTPSPTDGEKMFFRVSLVRRDWDHPSAEVAYVQGEVADVRKIVGGGF